MSRKIITLFVLICILMSAVAVPAYAADPSQSFAFELSVDGQQTKEVRTGDIITVVLHLDRTDSDDPYTMYAMQDEIRYDEDFFELVPDSEILSKGIRSSDMAQPDNFREFYMNFVSFSGGQSWQSRSLIGSFQLKVIGTSGVTKITNEDYLVSLKDGSGSYPCEANDLTIILSTECSVRFVTNGGSTMEDASVIYGEKLQKPENPVRDGKYFAGWFKDIDLKNEWDFETDTVTGNMTLYAKWSDTPVDKYLDDPDVPDDPDVSAGGFNPLWLLTIIPVLLIALILLKKRHSRKHTK